MSTFEPDVASLGEIAHDTWMDTHHDDTDEDWCTVARAVVEAYRRQQAEHGMVEVSRDDVTWALRIIADMFGDDDIEPWGSDWKDTYPDQYAIYQRIEGILAAAQEQPS